MSSNFRIRCPDRKVENIKYSKENNDNQRLLKIQNLLNKWEEHCFKNWIKFGKKDIIMHDSEDLIRNFLERCGTFLLLSQQRKNDILSYKVENQIRKNEVLIRDIEELENIKSKDIKYRKSKKTDLAKILELEKEGYQTTWCIVDRYNKFSFSGNSFCVWNNKDYAKQEVKVRKEVQEFFSMDKILIAYKEIDKIEKIDLGKHIVNKIIKIPNKKTFRFFDQNISEITNNILE